MGRCQWMPPFISLTLSSKHCPAAYSHVMPAPGADAAEKMNAVVASSVLGSKVWSKLWSFPAVFKFLADFLEKDGEPARNRTENPQIKSLLLCQLSYWPTCGVKKTTILT